MEEADTFVVCDVVFDEVGGDYFVESAVEDGHCEEGSRGGSGLCDLQD